MNNEKKITVIYHSADFDGIFCREIARKFLPDAELIGWDHGDPKLPFPAEGMVYVLDLSPDCFEQTKHVPGEGEVVAWMDAERLIWIDHHKSSIEKWPTDIPGYRIDGVAACRLAWQWFAHNIDPNRQTKEEFVERKVSEPLAVRLAGEYDIWDKRDPRAELFQHGLRSQELHAEVWQDLLAPDQEDSAWVEILLGQGEVLQYAAQRSNESIIKEIGFTIRFEGLTFLACNHARYNSHLFTAGLTPEHDACFGFKWTGKDWSISLYHAPGKEHHDLSLIAVKHGGGGHRGACGFRTKTLPFLPPPESPYVNN